MFTAELVFVFVSHGDAQRDADGVVGDPRACTGLTNLGYAQVERAAARLAAEHQDRGRAGRTPHVLGPFGSISGANRPITSHAK